MRPGSLYPVCRRIGNELGEFNTASEAAPPVFAPARQPHLFGDTFVATPSDEEMRAHFEAQGDVPMSHVTSSVIAPLSPVKASPYAASSIARAATASSLTASSSPSHHAVSSVALSSLGTENETAKENNETAKENGGDPKRIAAAAAAVAAKLVSGTLPAVARHLRHGVESAR